MEYLTHNLKETCELAEKFVHGELPCSCKPREHATVVGLYGELGSGKTSFTQGIARALKINSRITSPTFVLEKIYKLSPGLVYERMIHIDAYRLNGGREMRALGWDEILKNPKNLIFIEWPERVADALPKEMIKIYFEHGELEHERKIKILC